MIKPKPVSLARLIRLLIGFMAMEKMQQDKNIKAD